MKECCMVRGCKNEIRALNLCNKHWIELKRHGTLAPEIEDRKCRIKGCSELIKTKDYCAKHYRAILRYEEHLAEKLK